MVWVPPIVIVFCICLVFATICPEHLFADESQSIEQNAIQIVNKEVEALGLKLSDWKPETAENDQPPVVRPPFKFLHADTMKHLLRG